MQKEAAYYKCVEDGVVECLLCPHHCKIKDNASGICGIRINKAGKLLTTIFGEVTSIGMDPIEKKPLYHFYPGSSILSIGTRGCNFKCSYCQNWQISQNVTTPATQYSPEEIVDIAIQKKSIGIAYTYSEPLIWFEYVLECARLAREKGLKNVLVTNGFISREPLIELLKFTDAMNIDLKSFREKTYKRFQKGKLSPVLESIKTAHEKGCHIELTTLVVTGINDTIEEMREIVKWIASLDKNIPWHVSRYYPSYKYDEPATDIDIILNVCDEAMQSLNHVFCGNISGSYGRSDTICPSCKAVLISRSGYSTRVNALESGKCVKCGFDLKIPM